MIKRFTVTVRLPLGKNYELCEGKLVLSVINNTRFTSELELAPTKDFTKSDLKENPHFRNYFTEDEIGKKTRRRKVVSQEPTPEVTTTEVEVKKKKQKNVTKTQKQVELPKLNLPSFSIPSIKGTKPQ